MRAVLGGGFLAMVALAAASGWLPVLVPLAYGLVSIASYVMYTRDKAAARRGRRRIPEMKLHLVDLFGGWPGALVAQHLSRHKTGKASFQSVFWLTVVVNIVLVAWAVHGGLAGAPTATLPFP